MPFRFGVMADEERRKKKNKIGSFAIFSFANFLTSTKASKISRVVLHLDSEGLLVYVLKTGLLKRFRVSAPIPYVQDAILNIAHSYIVNATALTDNYTYF